MSAARALLVAGLVLVAIAPSHAGPGDETLRRAKAHFEAGRALYSLGSYEEALRELTAGYDLAPRPQFLLNIGQVYRKLGQPVKAREMFQRFVDSAPMDRDQLREARQTIVELDVEIARLPPPAAPVPTPIPTPTVSPAPAPIVQPDLTTALLVERSPTRSRWRRYWWTLPIAVVAAGGVAVGVYFGVAAGHKTDCSSPELGCLDLRQ